MDKQILIKKIGEGLSSRQIAKAIKKSQGSVKYWLRKYSLKTTHNQFGEKPVRYLCVVCGEKNPDNFYSKRRSYCKTCDNKRVAQLQREKKAKARKYLGGKCKMCGFDKYECSLDIHHLDPKNKDPNFRSMAGWAWERIKQEIRGCILVCRNCHTALHCGLVKGG